MADLAPITVEGSPAPAAPPTPEVRAVPTEPGYVALADQDGQVKSIPQANAERAIREFRYRPATEAEVYREQTGAAGTVAATAFGVGRGATFGLFDPLAVGASRALEGDAAAEETRRSLALTREGHETASLVGEVGGSLLPLALGAGPGASLEAGGSMLARAAARAAQSAPRLLLEGAAISGGQQLTEDILGNHELVAGKYVHAMGEGAIMNFLLGAGLHAAGGAVMDRLGARAARSGEGVAETVGKAEAKGYRRFGGAEGIPEGKGATYVDSRGVRRYVDSGGVVLESAGESAGGGVASRSGVGDRLAAFAEEQAAKGAMPSASLSGSELQRLGATAEEQQNRIHQIGRTLLNEGVTTPGASKGVQAERLTKRVGEVGEDLGRIRKSLEASPVRPSSENVLTKIEKEVMAPLGERAFSGDAERFLRPIVNEIAEKSGLAVGADGRVSMMRTSYESFEQLHKLRRDLDTKLSQYKAFERIGQAPPGHAELKQIRGILEGEYERAAELAARDIGEDVATKYRVAKGVYADLKTAEKWATKGAARDAQNQAISITDIMAAAGGAASGHLGLGLVAPIANKIRRTFGNQIAATVADKASKILGVQRAADVWDARLSKAVKGFYEGGGKKTGTAPTKMLDAKTLRALRTAANDPAALTERVAEEMRATGLQEAAPRVAGAMGGVLMRAATYLRTNLPKEPPPAGFSFGPTEPRKLGPYAQARAEAVVAALDTEGVLRDLESGKADRQRLQALAIINPEAHRDIVDALRRYGQANGAQLSHQQEVAMSIITGTPIGQLMQPRTIRGFQEAHKAGAPPDPAEAAGTQRQGFGNASGGGPSRTASTYASGTDKLERP
jgi:hypothetical protein